MSVENRWQYALKKAKESDKNLSKDTNDFTAPVYKGKTSADIGRWEPQFCVQMLRIPGTHKFSSIKKLIQKASKEWLLEFLKEGGLGVLLECLERLSNRLTMTVTAAMGQLHCVACLRAVTNSQVGLQFITKDLRCTNQLASILASSTSTVKLQVFELLCALCMFSKEGHDFTMCTLEKFKSEHGYVRRFDLVLLELKNTTTFEYQTVLLAFINCVIYSEPEVHVRNKIRNEFLMTGLHEILEEFKQIDDDSLQIQLIAFEEHRRTDEMESPVVSHHQLLDQLEHKISHTPHYFSLYCLLQELASKDYSQKDNSDKMWETLNMVACQEWIIARLLTNNETSKKDVGVQTIETRSAGQRRKVFRAQNACGNKPVLNGYLNKQQSCPIVSDQTITENEDVESGKCATCDSDGKATQSSGKQSRLNPFSVNDVVIDTVKPDATPSISSTLSAQPSLSVSPFTLTDSDLPSSTPLLELPTRDSSCTIFSISIPPADSSYMPAPTSVPDNAFHADDKRLLIHSTSPGPSANDKISSIPPPPPLPSNIVAMVNDKSASTPPLSPLTSNSASIPPPSPFPSNSAPISPPLTSNLAKIPPPSPLPSNSAPIPPPPPLPSNVVKIPPPPPLPSSSASIPLPPQLPPCIVPSATSDKLASIPPPPPLPLNMSFAIQNCGAPPVPPPLPPSSTAPSPTSSSLSPPPPPPPPSTLTVARSTNVKSLSSSLSSSFKPMLPSNNYQMSNVVLNNNQKSNSFTLPKSKMRTINWAKLSNQSIGGSLWSMLDIPSVPINYNKLEELFCRQQKSDTAVVSSSTVKSQPKVQEVNLLDSRRSLTINIFLKQFKSGPKEIFDAINNGGGLELEKLRGLKKILPDSGEIKLLNNYTGDKENLATAEKFYTQLIEIPNYVLIIDILLEKEECPQSVKELKPKLMLLRDACYRIIDDQHFKQFLAIVLELGNFLNMGSYAGNAVGFKLNTLPKLMDVRANKPRVTFLHYVISIIQSNHNEILSFVEHSKLAHSVARTPLALMEEEACALTTKVKNLNTKLHSANDEKLQTAYSESLKEMAENTKNLEALLKDVNTARHKLAQHFCEDPAKFVLEDCFSLLASFFDKVQQVITENEQQRKLEEKNKKLEAEREMNKKNRKKKSISKVDSEVCLVDLLMQDIRKGSFSLRRTCNGMRAN